MPKRGNCVPWFWFSLSRRQFQSMTGIGGMGLR